MKPRTLRILESPEAGPVTVEDVKLQLGIPEALEDHDAMLAGMIATAARLVERRLGITLQATQYRAKFGPGVRLLELPAPPLLLDEEYGITVEVDGEAIAASGYELDEDARPAEIVLDEPAGEEVVVTYWGGVPEGGSIPPQLRSAILLYVGHLYAHREATTQDATAEVPLAFETLLASESVSGGW